MVLRTLKIFPTTSGSFQIIRSGKPRSHAGRRVTRPCVVLQVRVMLITVRATRRRSETLPARFARSPIQPTPAIQPSVFYSGPSAATAPLWSGRGRRAAARARRHRPRPLGAFASRPSTSCSTPISARFGTRARERPTVRLSYRARICIPTGGREIPPWGF